MITFESHIDYLDKLKLYYLFIPKEMVEKLNDAAKTTTVNHRVFAYAKDHLITRGGLVALGDGNAYLTLSKKVMLAFNLKLDDTILISLDLDKSKYGMDVPLEFEEILIQDDRYKLRFEGLTLGAQRVIIYKINQIKSIDKRIEKSLFYLQNLLTTKIGQEDFRIIFGLKSKND